MFIGSGKAWEGVTDGFIGIHVELDEPRVEPGGRGVEVRGDFQTGEKSDGNMTDCFR